VSTPFILEVTRQKGAAIVVSTTDKSVDPRVLGSVASRIAPRLPPGGEPCVKRFVAHFVRSVDAHKEEVGPEHTLEIGDELAPAPAKT
jgi:hypothetical protein